MTKECSRCGSEDVEEEGLLVGKTTQANIDEVWDKHLVCCDCGWAEEIDL